MLVIGRLFDDRGAMQDEEEQQQLVDQAEDGVVGHGQRSMRRERDQKSKKPEGGGDPGETAVAHT